MDSQNQGVIRVAVLNDLTSEIRACFRRFAIKLHDVVRDPVSDIGGPELTRLYPLGESPIIENATELFFAYRNTRYSDNLGRFGHGHHHGE